MLELMEIKAHDAARDIASPGSITMTWIEAIQVMNVIDSKSLARDAGGKPVSTFPHPARGRRRDMSTAEAAFLVLIITTFVVFGVSLFWVDRRCQAPDETSGDKSPTAN